MPDEDEAQVEDAPITSEGDGEFVDQESDNG